MEAVKNKSLPTAGGQAIDRLANGIDLLFGGKAAFGIIRRRPGQIIDVAVKGCLFDLLFALSGAQPVNRQIALIG